LNELLQNADDASATVFKVLFDKRTRGNGFGKTSLLAPSLQDFQGPAIYQFDDAVFEEKDYESIQRVGDGLKRGDPTKTGQFGLGFNSVYHVTELPSFISGDNLILLDPHRLYLPQDTTSGDTGKHNRERVYVRQYTNRNGLISTWIHFPLL
jgi:sacsin